MARKSEPTACACAAYAVRIDGGETKSNECTAQTGSKFAPGHDAKLKSLLIFAGTCDHEVVKTLTEGGTETMTAVEAAQEHGFGSQVATGIQKANERHAAKAAREAERQRKIEERQREKEERRAKREQEKAEREERKRVADEQKNRLPDPGPYRAKVGSSEFDGEVTADGLFHFEVDGEPRTAEKYTILPS